MTEYFTGVSRILTCVDRENSKTLLCSVLNIPNSLSSTFILPQYFGSDMSSNEESSVQPENSGYLAKTRKQSSFAWKQTKRISMYLHNRVDLDKRVLNLEGLENQRKKADFVKGLH